MTSMNHTMNENWGGTVWLDYLISMPEQAILARGALYESAICGAGAGRRKRWIRSEMIAS
jgi:hypothetical protein